MATNAQDPRRATRQAAGNESPPHVNLPIALTSFIGRRREIAEVTALLPSSRLVTLTGTAGCGKTRLALRVAAEVSRRYRDGVYWVELAGLADPSLVPSAIVRALHLTDLRGRDEIDSLLGALRQKRLLLVLSNCEHVLSACALVVQALLPATEVSILATSREPLGVTGERRYPLAPMSLPPAGLAPDDMLRFDAIQLFVERARSVLPEFSLTPENAQAVAGICHHLDGVPLAIELASARVNVLAVEQIHARLDDRFDLLAPAAHLTQSHHRTLRAAIDWSYDLLTPAEQLLLQRLSVFAGGWSLATAEALSSGDGIEQQQVLGLLSSLVNKSLVVAHTLQRGEARYSLLETIRQYAQEKVAAGDQPALRDRHLRCFLQLAEETGPKLTGRYQRLWLNWLETEYANIRAALAWSLQSAQIEAGLRIAIAIYQFWTIRDYAKEALAWMERLLARADDHVSDSVHANALAYAAFLAGFQGNAQAQAAYGHEATLLAEAAGDAGKPALRWALAAQAYGARAAGDYQTEFTVGKRVIQLNRELGDTYQLGVTLSIYSFSAMSLGDFDAARAMLDEGLALLRLAGSPYRIAMALNFSGDLARCQQDYNRAQSAYEESIALLRELGAVRDLASALHNLGHACLHLGDTERARALLAESMAIHQAQQNTPSIAECVIGFAGLAIVSKSPGAGARLLAAALAIGGERTATAWAATRMEYDHYLALARSALPEAEFQAQQAAGRSLSLEQALDDAHNLPVRARLGATTKVLPDDLTAREREVSRLIAQAKSNTEIAGELVVSKRTVEKHIANILAKLGFSHRAQIVRWAIETGLLSRSGK